MSTVSPRTIYQVHLTQVIDHTDEIRELRLNPRTPDEFKFRAGQFVMLHVPPTSPFVTGPDGQQKPAKPALRAYSLASSEHETKEFRLIFKKVPGGVASDYVWALKGDETLQFTGPFGKLFFPEPPTRQLVFLNTGSGISQHYCYILSKLERYPDMRLRLLFGLRYEKDIYYRKELDALAARAKDFKYDFVLSRPTPTWTGKKGYIQNHLADFDYKNIETTFFMCGNGAMIKDAKKILIEENGVEPSRILAEAFD